MLSRSYRRNFLKQLCQFVLGTAAFSPWLGSGLYRIGRAAETQFNFCVSVHAPDGTHYDGPATVTATPISGAPPIPLNPAGALRPTIYSAPLTRGQYKLKVTANGYFFPGCDLDVEKSSACAAVYLSLCKNCFRYHIGSSVITFFPRLDLIAVYVPHEFAVQDNLVDFVKRFKKFGLTPYLTEKHKEDSSIIVNNHIWLFAMDGLDVKDSDAILKARTTAHANFLEEITKELDSLKVHPNAIRFCLPVDLSPGHVKLLDRRYVVRRKTAISDKEFSTYFEQRKINATLVRKLNIAPNAFLIEFNDLDYRQQLETVEDLLRTKEYLYIEPDMVIQLTKHDFPTEDSMGKIAKCQSHIKLQRVREGWNYLASKLGKENAFGSNKVCLGIVDYPTDPNHYDIDVKKVPYCFDFRGIDPVDPGATYSGQSCFTVDSPITLKPNVRNYAGRDFDPHGMRVFGIVGAEAVNAKGIVGVAPNIMKILAVPPEPGPITLYCEVMLWLAGLGIPYKASPEQLGVKLPKVDVITSSLGCGRWPTPAQVCDTFVRLTTEGRDKKGIVIVYAAGNESQDIGGVEAFAADPHVISVGCTKVVTSANQDIEVRWTDGPSCPATTGETGFGSNCGARLDISALSEGGPAAQTFSLDTESSSTFSCAGDPTEEKLGSFGKTSGAAPMVAGAAALILTARPDLTWYEIRDILRTSAYRPTDGSDQNLREGQWVDSELGSKTFNPLYGFGRLNVEAALVAAISYKRPKDFRVPEIKCAYSSECGSCRD